MTQVQTRNNAIDPNQVFVNPYFDGLEFEEDTEVIQNRMADFLGENGEYALDGKLVTISAPRHGKLWYGDLVQDRFDRMAKVMPPALFDTLVVTPA